MSDKELLEFAARAFDDEGIHISGDQYVRFLGDHEDQTPCFTVWNPLENDADAFQLMCKLKINLYVGDGDVETSVTPKKGYFEEVFLEFWNDEQSKMIAARRVIVMAAAEIGKGM